MTPLLKWVGGKRWLVPQVLDLLPDRISGTYYEPFAGGAAVFFALRPEQLPLFSERRRQHAPRAALCDLSYDLVEFYAAVRDEPERVMAVLGPLRDRYLADPVGGTPAAGPRADLYREVRAELNRSRGCCALDRRSRRAAWFLFVNKTGYNGLMRYSRSGDLNTPHGAMRRPEMFDPAHVRAVSAALRGVRLSCADFEEDLAGAGPGDAVYLDPPHAPRGGGGSFAGGYTGAGWTAEDDVRVARRFWDLAGRGARVVLSQADTPRARRLLFEEYRPPGIAWSLSVCERRGTVSSRGDGRGSLPELLVAAGPRDANMTGGA